MAYNFINLDYLEMMCDGDQDMKKVMLDMLLSEIPEETEKLNALFTKKDWTEMSAVSHKMKSTLSFVGNEPYIETNKQIEKITKHEEGFSALPELLKSMDDYASKALIELKLEAGNL